jgi:transcriptional regulator with XRE-family HTH domain
MEPVDHRAQVRTFLTSRRERITPEQVGLPAWDGARRRVKGLRREEVAQLAGVSIDYYVRMERGNLAGASDAVLEGVARALRLDEAERSHLFDLARVASASPARRRPSPDSELTPGIRRVLDAVTDSPAWIRNGRHDILGANQLARALYAPLLAGDRRPANNARFVYLDPAAREFYTDHEQVADDVAALLRTEAGRNPFDRRLTDLIGELSTLSADFRTRWARNDVRFHRTGVKRLRHPAVGPVELTFEALDFPSRPGLTMFVYTAPPGSAAADALALLASWAETAERAGELAPV